MTGRYIVSSKNYRTRHKVKNFFRILWRSLFMARKCQCSFLISWVGIFGVLCVFRKGEVNKISKDFIDSDNLFIFPLRIISLLLRMYVHEPTECWYVSSKIVNNFTFSEMNNRKKRPGKTKQKSPVFSFLVSRLF